MLHLKEQKVKNICPPAPRSEDGSAGGGWGGCQAVRAWKPRGSTRKLGGRNRAEISLSFFEFFSGGRKRKIVRENFCEVAAGAIAEAGGGVGAYDFVQSHHALGACLLVGRQVSVGVLFKKGSDFVQKVPLWCENIFGLKKND